MMEQREVESAGLEINVSADEIIDELIKKVAHLSMEIAAKDIVIRKLEAKLNEK